MTPELREELIGEQTSVSVEEPHPDGESVALWNPEWRVECPEFEGAPAKLTNFHGSKNVLMTHPIDRDHGSGLERVIEVPAGKKVSLRFLFAAHEQGDWELRVFVGDKLLKKQKIDRNGDRWKSASVDLSALTGQTTRIRLENCANDWAWEFGYWSDIQLHIADL